MATLDLANVGTADNAGDGDPIRNAHTKHNANLTAINTQVTAFVDGSGLSADAGVQGVAGATAGAVAEGDSVNAAILKLLANQQGSDTNDQASSGYFDIGSMRIQSGFANVATTATTVPLPAPFANADYVLNADQDAGASNGAVRCVNTGNKTTTGFQATAMEYNGSGPFSAARRIQWHAIGLKP